MELPVRLDALAPPQQPLTPQLVAQLVTAAAPGRGWDRCSARGFAHTWQGTGSSQAPFQALEVSRLWAGTPLFLSLFSVLSHPHTRTVLHSLPHLLNSSPCFPGLPLPRQPRFNSEVTIWVPVSSPTSDLQFLPPTISWPSYALSPPPHHHFPVSLSFQTCPLKSLLSQSFSTHSSSKYVPSILRTFYNSSYLQTLLPLTSPFLPKLRALPDLPAPQPCISFPHPPLSYLPALAETASPPHFQLLEDSTTQSTTLKAASLQVPVLVWFFFFLPALSHQNKATWHQIGLTTSFLACPYRAELEKLAHFPRF